MPEKAFSVCIKDSVFIEPIYNRERYLRGTQRLSVIMLAHVDPDTRIALKWTVPHPTDGGRSRGPVQAGQYGAAALPGAPGPCAIRISEGEKRFCADDSLSFRGLLRRPGNPVLAAILSPGF